VEGLMLRVICVYLLFLNIAHAEKFVGRLYYSHIMGHVHKNPSDYSASLTTVQCGFGLKVIEDKDVSNPVGWLFVKAGEDRGFVREEFLTSKRPSCFQAKYPKFFNALNLDLTDMYYWGRLYDHYMMEESRAR
jgi:hypothetical protein